MKRSFVHVSDFHMNGYRGPPAADRILPSPHTFIDILNAAALAVLRHIAREFKGADLLLFSGDLFGHGRDDHDHAELLGALMAIKRGGTAIAFCTGSHDERDKKGLAALEPHCAAFFKRNRWTLETVRDVAVWGLGNSRSAAEHVVARNELASKRPTNAPSLLLAHRKQDVPNSKDLRLQPSYVACGHNHDASGRGLAKIPGSIPCFVLSRFVERHAQLRALGLSKTLAQVGRAGLVSGEIEKTGAGTMRFHQASCAHFHAPQDVVEALAFNPTTEAW